MAEIDLRRRGGRRVQIQFSGRLPVTLALIEHVDELRELLRECREQLPVESAQTLIERINAALSS